MKRFIVSITPVSEDGSHAESAPSMIARIEVDDDEAHVVEFTVRASARADLLTSALPAIDLEHLALAFGSRGPAVLTPHPDVAVPSPAAAPGRVPRRSPARRPRRSPAPPAPAGLEVPAARAYRRMPDPESLQQVYSQVGSIAGVAKHYDVPTHTAQGWIGRLRRTPPSVASGD